MKSRTALICLATLALFAATPAATARPSHHSRGDGVAIVSHHAPAPLQRTGYNSADVTSLKIATAHSDAACRELFPMQSSGYDACLQQLPASAVIGNGLH